MKKYNLLLQKCIIIRACMGGHVTVYVCRSEGKFWDWGFSFH